MAAGSMAASFSWADLRAASYGTDPSRIVAAISAKIASTAEGRFFAI